MQLQIDKKSPKVVATHYILTLPSDRPFAYLADHQGNELVALFVPSGVHPMTGRDDTLCLDAWEIESTDDEITDPLPPKAPFGKARSIGFIALKTG